MSRKLLKNMVYYHVQYVFLQIFIYFIYTDIKKQKITSYFQKEIFSNLFHF